MCRNFEGELGKISALFGKPLAFLTKKRENFTKKEKLIPPQRLYL